MNYENSILKLSLDSLETRRHILCLKFAKSGIKYEKMNDLFPRNEKQHNMKTRKAETYDVKFANTERLKKGSIIAMQKYLNEETSENRKRNVG